MHLIAMMFISLSPKLASKKGRKKKKAFYLEPIIKLGDNNYCSSKGWINFTNGIQPQ